MKKVFTSMLLLAAMLVAVPAQAQGVKFGVKGGYNITSMSIKGGTQAVADNLKDNKNGWYIGPTVKVSLLAGLGVDGAIFYDQRETDLGSGQAEETIKQQSIFVPINLRYNIGLGGLAGIYGAVGPQFGFNVGDADFSLKNAVSQVEDKFQLKKATFGINVGAGVYLLKRLEVGFVYNIPLGNTADYSEGTALGGTVEAAKKFDVKSNTWQVSAAVYF